MVTPVVQPDPQQPAQPQPKGKPWLGLVGASAITIACIFAAPHEGTIYRAYPDPATHGKPWTICNGHTAGVQPGDTATKAQCDAWLAQDMAVAAATVARCIHVPLNVNQAASFYDTEFNVKGHKSMCGSTLQRMANAGDLTGACNQLPRWNKAARKVWKGLTTRRMDARELCLYPTTNPQLVLPRSAP